jgi:hypothetical protein
MNLKPTSRPFRSLSLSLSLSLSFSLSLSLSLSLFVGSETRYRVKGARKAGDTIRLLFRLVSCHDNMFLDYGRNDFAKEKLYNWVCESRLKDILPSESCPSRGIGLIGGREEARKEEGSKLVLFFLLIFLCRG